jgi:hypothetical protein
MTHDTSHGMYAVAVFFVQRLMGIGSLGTIRKQIELFDIVLRICVGYLRFVQSETLTAPIDNS